MDAFRKQYIGDGVYVEVSNAALLLTTDRNDEGGPVTHYIVLEPDVMDNLIGYYMRAKEQARRLHKET